MGSRLLPTAFAVLLSAISCATGDQYLGGGGAAVGSSGTSATSATMSTSISSSGSGGASSASASSSAASSSSGMCAETPCKLTAPQCGCPAGKACTFAPPATTRSCQKAGTATAGQGCQGIGQCAPGSICLGGGMQGVCTEFCKTDADCTATGGICALQLSDGLGGSIPNENLCSGTCDVTTNAGCAVPGTGCQIGIEQAGQMRTFTLCESSGTKGKKQTCATVADCLPKFDCVNTGTSNVCLQYCYVNGTTCPICTPLTYGPTMTPIYVGPNQVGVCQ